MIVRHEIWIGKPLVNGEWYSYNNSPQYPLQPYYSVPNNEVAEVPAYVTAHFTTPGATTSDVQFIDATDPSITWGFAAGAEDLDLNFDFYDYNQWVIFKVTASNSCGPDEYDVAFYTPEQEMGTYTYSPNPADNHLLISYNSRADSIVRAANKNYDKIYTLKPEIPQFKVSLFNAKGEAIHSAKSNGKPSITVDTRNIPDGFYVLHIIEGEKTIKKHVIIEH